MSGSWISIYDNSQDARLVYVSESITDFTGWEPEQVIGVGGYDFFHPTDHAALRKVHVSNIVNEKMSSMVSYRFKCRSGNYIPVETIVHYCYDVLITCNFMYDPHSTDHKMRANTVDQVYACLPDGSLQLSGAWNDRAHMLENTLNLNPSDFQHGGFSKEKRFALIMNRYSEALNIVYASQLSRDLVSLDISNSIGLSFFDFVPEKDIETLHTQIDLAKEHDMIVRIRFDWVTDFKRGLSEPLEAITSCTDDGLVMVLRSASKITLDG